MTSANVGHTSNKEIYSVMCYLRDNVQGAAHYCEINSDPAYYMAIYSRNQ